jgi:hypothetical protein
MNEDFWEFANRIIHSRGGMQAKFNDELGPGSIRQQNHELRGGMQAKFNGHAWVDSA